MTNAPGKHYREGAGVIELMEMFPDEDSARDWFESAVCPTGCHCPRCGCVETREAARTSGLPYYCTGCHKPFSVKIGTAIQKSNLPLRKWVFAIYLEMTSLKGVSSMKLHRDLKVTQKTAWFALNRILLAWAGAARDVFEGPVEVDETYVGGKRGNTSNAERKELKESGVAGRGAVGKAGVVGMKDRETGNVVARVAEDTTTGTLQGFVTESTREGATVYTDDAKAYKGVGRTHEVVRHSVSEYAGERAHTNGIESFWSMPERSCQGAYHKMSPKHIQRYVDEFAGRHNIREADTIAQMRDVAARMVGKRIMYRELIAENGLSSGARPSA